jgi:hypothetical protein
MAQIPNMNWMGNEPTGSAYDVYQYYLGGGSPGGTSTPSAGGGISSLPWYQQTGGGGGGGGFNLPQNYYKAPNLGTPVRSMTSDGLREYTTGLPQDNKVKNYLQNLKFPGKQLFAGAGNLLKKGVGSLASFAGGFLPKMSPEARANQRWAVDDAGYGTGTQRDQFGMLVGQSLMDPDRTYEDRLSDREEELNEIIAKQIKKGTYKKSGWHQRQLEHIKQVNEIKEKEQVAKEKAQLAAYSGPKTKSYDPTQSGGGKGPAGTGGHYSGRGGSGSGPQSGAGYGPWKAQGGMITDFNKDPEYRGWKKMYEANPEIGSMHEKHPTFIKFYKKHERDRKKFGGLAGLLYG